MKLVRLNYSENIEAFVRSKSDFTVTGFLLTDHTQNVVHATLWTLSHKLQLRSIQYGCSIHNRLALWVLKKKKLSCMKCVRTNFFSYFLSSFLSKINWSIAFSMPRLILKITLKYSRKRVDTYISTIITLIEPKRKNIFNINKFNYKCKFLVFHHICINENLVLIFPMRVHTHTHSHKPTHTHIRTRVCVYVCLFVKQLNVNYSFKKNHFGNNLLTVFEWLSQTLNYW